MENDREEAEVLVTEAENRRPKKRRKKLSRRNVELVKKSFEQRGIIYLGRIPPRMDVRICRRVLSQYGEIGRMHFATEDMEEYKERKQNGGCRKRGYVEGWVEFMDKKIAKKFVRRYNAQPIGGKRHSPFYEELWCVKYLPQFKWDHLLEGIRYRKMLYQQEVKQELADAKKQQEVYLNRVQAARRLQKSEKESDASQEKSFTQIEPIPDPVLQESETGVTDELLALFGGQMKP